MSRFATACIGLLVVALSGCGSLPPDEAFDGVEKSLRLGSLLADNFGDGVTLTRSSDSLQSASVGCRVVFVVAGSKAKGRLDVQAENEPDEPWHAHHVTLTVEGQEPVIWYLLEDGTWSRNPS